MTRTVLSLALASSLAAAGCSCSDDPSGTDGDGSTASLDGSTLGMDGSAIVPQDGSPFTTDPTTGCVLCTDGECCACNNGVDDDGDGLVDGFDPECTGPYDDDEDTFATGIPGDNIDFCQDCFFDGNSGMGDDGCAYHTDCLYGETPPGGGGADCFNCDVSAECIDFCRPRTPNGCDCFGCCTVFLDDGSSVNVVLVEGCSLENIDDTTACPRCVQSTDCINECGECELCLGRTADDLPDHCSATPDGGTPDGGTGGYTCDSGEQVCNDTMPCPDGYYCQLGCCLTSIF